MGKKNKKKSKQNKTKINPILSDPTLFAMVNAVDMSVLLEEATQKEWKPEEHSELENYFHFRAKAFGR